MSAGESENPKNHNGHPYKVEKGRTYVLSGSKTKSTWTELANFAARIKLQRVFSDTDRDPEFVIEATLSDKTIEVVVTCRELQTGDWILRLLGPGAIVTPGFQTYPHFRGAIGHLSGSVPVELLPCHTGWINHAGHWKYLHVGGHIGDKGYHQQGTTTDYADFSKLLSDRPLQPEWTEWTVSRNEIGNLRSHLPESLARYDLTTPLEGVELRDGIRSVLRLLDVAPIRITAPLFGAIFRAPLGAMNSTIHFAGPPQTRKTALAAVAQQFFGALMDAEHLPGHWSGTAYSLESLGHTLKDSLFVVDDFAPSGSESDVRRLHRDAERLIRSAANHSGRTRATSTGEVRAAKPPRGLMISTGEDIPEGKSLRLRMLTITIEPGNINTVILSKCQRHATSGVYARVMASYLTWLAPQYDSLLAGWTKEREAWKDHPIPDTVERRTYFACKELELGYFEFLQFASEVLDFDYVAELGQSLFDGLMETAILQAAHVSTADPVDKFLATLRSAFLLGKAHLEDRMTNEHPEVAPQLWGWKKVMIKSDRKTDEKDHEATASKDAEATNAEDEFVKTWQRQGPCIGWVDCNYLFIDADAASTVLYPIASQARNPISITMLMLERQLADRGVINRDTKRNRIRKRLKVNGTIRSVLEMPMTSLLWLTERGPDIEEQEEEDELRKSYRRLLG